MILFHLTFLRFKSVKLKYYFRIQLYWFIEIELISNRPLILLSCTLKTSSLVYSSIEGVNKKAPSAVNGRGFELVLLCSLEREPDSEPEDSWIENSQILIEVGRGNACLFLE